MAKEFTITVKGESQSDVEIALEEVLRLVKDGYSSGLGSNDSGSFSFTSTGEYSPVAPEPPPENCPRCGEHIELARTPDEAYCSSCGLRMAFDQVLGEWIH